MGAVSFSLDPTIVTCLKQSLPLDVFVETGTFEGETVMRVVPYFAEIHTVELAEEYYTRARERLKSEPSVRVYSGSSESCLRTLRPALKEKSVLYWLDAHWCSSDATAGIDSQCPLLEELDAIGHLNQESVILLDDARLFLSPPPNSHAVAHWPSFHAVVQKLFQLSPYHEVMVLNDVIVFSPDSVREMIRAYASEHTIDWLSVLDKSRQYDVLLCQLKEKEAEIEILDAAVKMIAAAAEERLRQSLEKEAVIQTLDTTVKAYATVAEERLHQLQEKEALIQTLDTTGKGFAALAEERLKVIERLLKERERHWPHLMVIAVRKFLQGYTGNIRGKKAA